MTGKPGNYSNIIIYDERKRYFYMWPQKNKPLLDDEIRDMGVGLLDQVRRSVQANYGDVAAPVFQYSRPTADTTSAFKVIEHPTDNIGNFRVTGGSSLDHPGVLYVKGFYVFIAENPIDYKHQYANVDLGIAPDAELDKSLKVVPTLSVVTEDRIDIVYLDLYFEEVTAAPGTDQDVYFDSKLKNPIVGTETANRLRACIDIKVKENWTASIDQSIFDHSYFLGSNTTSDTDPTNNHYKAPLAAIYRHKYSSNILAADIIDLLSLYNKRIYSAEEVSYRMKHGGYVQQDVGEKGYTGFTAQFPGAIVDEGAFATGLNRGLGSEAFNTNAVTPRVLSNDGKFMLGGLMVGHDTGVVNYATGPEALHSGEAILKDLSARHIYAGYGVTGITGARSYIDVMNVVIKGESGKVGLSVTNVDGSNTSKTVAIQAVSGGSLANFVTVDNMARVGLNTNTPGWSGPSLDWYVDRYNQNLGGATGINIVLDVDGSARVTKELFVDKDVYVEGGVFGKTWYIPETISQATPGLFGFTGIPNNLGPSELPYLIGTTGSLSSMIFKRGIAVVGDTGVYGYGHTGMGIAGLFESFDAEGLRLFTIGDQGDGFDRSVRQPFGMSLREAFVSDYSLLGFPTGLVSGIQTGDVISYTLNVESGIPVHETYTSSGSGYTGLAELQSHILSNPQYIHGVYQYTYTYNFYNTDQTTETRTGTTRGVEFIRDPAGASYGFDYNGRIVFKSIPEDPVNVNLTSVIFTVTRGATTITVPFTRTHYYGTSSYGGEIASYKFAKFDLGEGADAWLFNGDVYFNGDGNLGKVDFSPSAFFRNDVFVYGTMFADQIVFNLAKLISMVVENQLTVEKLALVKKGLAVGDQNALDALVAMKTSDPRILALFQGKTVSEDFEARSADASSYSTGSVIFSSSKNPDQVYAVLGGSHEDPLNPYGLKLVDGRNEAIVDPTIAFKDIHISARDGSNNSRNVNLVVEGDITSTRYLLPPYIGVNLLSGTSPDPTYVMQVNGRTQINDTLEVKAIKFTSSVAPEGTQDIVDPANISVISRDSLALSSSGEDIQNDVVIPGILREKKFTNSRQVFPNNVVDVSDSGLYAMAGTTGVQEYYNRNIDKYYQNPTIRPNGRWAIDTISYTNEQFNSIVANQTNKNQIIVSDISGSGNDIYKKYLCERIVVANVGKIRIKWDGYKFDPAGTSGDVINTYQFESNYFRTFDSTKNSTVNWMTSGRGSDNYVIKVEGTLIDTHPSYPQIYTINKSISVYIPKDRWLRYMSGAGLVNDGYRSFVMFYPYELAIQNFNEFGFDKQTDFSSDLNEYSDPGWRLALYPRLSTLTRDATLSSTYNGEWELDVVLLPRYIGKVSNLIGKLYISYMQA